MRTSRVLTAATGLLLLAGLAVPAPAHATSIDRTAACETIDTISGNGSSTTFSFSPQLTFRQYETMTLRVSVPRSSLTDTVTFEFWREGPFNTVTRLTAPVSAGKITHTFPLWQSLTHFRIIGSNSRFGGPLPVGFDLQCGSICAAAPSGFNVITGTSGTDTIVGTSGNDFITGGGGNDVISGEGGDDIVCAGAGDDFVSGGPGNDILAGDAGVDFLNGNDGYDTGIDTGTTTRRSSIEIDSMEAS